MASANFLVERCQWAVEMWAWTSRALIMSRDAAEVDVAGLAVPPPRLDGLEPAPTVGAGGDAPAATAPPCLPAEGQDRDREEHGEQEQLGTHPSPIIPLTACGCQQKRVFPCYTRRGLFPC